ncbi:MAG: thioredoxin-like domain-containing protein [Cyclobacteriaceae bacterium]|nr:thioredoxin-like domain-containing protein [Cyclobacteriaceae bacterium]MCX7636529.1 thioredoxin-like domain-containing protein [Cyclobacteriaceae bacterium]MDW8330104.1 thioredoxin-like domain-containing protein [Cyclobacteriaceae bacterium]
MHKLVVLLLSFVGLIVQAQPKPGYAIRCTIHGLKDTTVYLGYYYGESTFVRDTAKVDKHGRFLFDGKKSLPQGIYFVVLDKTRLFDMAIGPNQHFSIETDASDYIRKAMITGDEDNRLFFDNMRFNMERNKEAEPFIKILQDTTSKDEQRKKEAREGWNKINEKVIAYQKDIIARYPQTMTARLLKTQQRIEIPDPPKKADGSIDSTFQLRYYRQHFFDNFDLSDDALIRLPQPLYSKKVNEYLDQLFVPQVDSLKKAIHWLIDRAKKNQETYKYMVWLITIKYQNPEIMGLDELFVYMYDTYFASGEMDFWINEKLKKNLKDHASQLRKSLIGRTAPNLIMQDMNLQPRSLYALKNKYTIVYFFDPDCGHCKVETPKLVSFYNKNKQRFDLEVFAVSADTSMQKMRDYIKEMKMTWVTVNGPRTYVGSYHDLYDAQTTPTIYVLDDKKKIIGKKISAERLEDFLANYERIRKNQTKSAGS